MALVMGAPCLADEARVGGSAGFDVWYANWESENQWSKQGVDLDYDINPALVYGYSASINYFRKKTFIRGLMLDLLTSKIEHEINSEAFDGKDRDHGFYRKIRGKINQRHGSNGYFFIQGQHAKFEGEVTVERGGSALDVPDGTTWDLDTTWFKGDVMYLFDLGDYLAGLGFRYISYNKPETSSLFAATGEKQGVMTSGELLSGEVAETDFKGYYLAFGGWDQSFIGIPGDSLLFIDLLGYFGVVFAENDIVGKDDGIGGGIEGSIGIKYSYRFSDTSALTGRLGYRALYNKMGTSLKRRAN